jgi:rhodanese-related sulfurtransferase
MTAKPSLLIVLEIEGEPFVLIDCRTDSEFRRLHDRLDARPDLRELIQHVLDLIQREAAA